MYNLEICKLFFIYQIFPEYKNRLSFKLLLSVSGLNFLEVSYPSQIVNYLELYENENFRLTISYWKHSIDLRDSICAFTGVMHV